MSSGKLVKGSQNYVWFSDQRLGKGAMGTVYLARHRRKGVKFAAKTFNAESMTEFIHRELSILRQMTDHEHIVKLIAIEEETYSRSNVVIMELCDGGSLQRILEEPENFNGLAHDEWLLVFVHIFKALKHLHHHKIVHRDIKPGNILLQIASDGSHVYKLTDFGAANLQDDDEEGFKTLCGTEEYLHPEVHSSAFVRRIPGQVYGHYVDIWSFGVTMYQCATGRLPFRPREGVRKNKQMMNDLMTNKSRRVISKYEREDGQIVEERHLPPTCRLFSGTRDLITDFLARIFDLKEKWSEADFFSVVTEFCENQPVYLYYFDNNSMICVHLKHDDRLMHLKEEIARCTETPIHGQILLMKGEPLEKITKPNEQVLNWPETSPEDPILVINRHPHQVEHPSTFGDLPSLPEPGPGESVLVSDARWAAQVCGNIHHFMYLTRYLVWIQCHLLSLRTSLKDMIDKLYHTVGEAMKRQQSTQQYLAKLLSTLKAHHSHCLRDTRHTDSFVTKPVNVEDMQSICHKEHDVSKQQYTKIDKAIREMSLLVKKGLKPNCMTAARCREKGEMLLKDSVPLYEGIQQDKTKRELPHNDMEIHKYNRAELKRVHHRFQDNLREHCVQQANLQYQETGDFCRGLLSSMVELESLEESLVSFDGRQTQLGDDLLKLLSDESDFEGPSWCDLGEPETRALRYPFRNPHRPLSYRTAAPPSEYHHFQNNASAPPVSDSVLADHEGFYFMPRGQTQQRNGQSKTLVPDQDLSVRPRDVSNTLSYLSIKPDTPTREKQKRVPGKPKDQRAQRFVGRSPVDNASTTMAESGSNRDNVTMPIQVSDTTETTEPREDS